MSKTSKSTCLCTKDDEKKVMIKSKHFPPNYGGATKVA